MNGMIITEHDGDVDVNVGDGGNETYLSSANYPFFHSKAFRYYRQTNGGSVGNPSTHHRTRTFYIAKG